MRRLIKIVRNLLLLVIAAILVLAGVLAFNVFTHGSRQLQVAAVPRAPVDAQGAAARLSEAIRFKTISTFENPDSGTEALLGLQAHIEKSFPAFHAAARREVAEVQTQDSEPWRRRCGSGARGWREAAV